MESVFSTIVRKHNLSNISISIESGNLDNVIKVSNLVEVIEYQIPEIQKEIELVFKKIDRENGDLTHYLKFLATHYFANKNKIKGA